MSPIISIKRSIVRSIFYIVLLYAPSGFSLADSRVEGWDDLVSVYYRLEVCNYCGLTDENVAKGFTIASDIIIQNHNITPELLDSARAEAWKAGYREWDNRGLGGFRRWCANEGASYVEYFVGVSERNS